MKNTFEISKFFEGPLWLWGPGVCAGDRGGRGVPTTYAQGEGVVLTPPSARATPPQGGGDIMRPVAQGLLPFAKGITSS